MRIKVLIVILAVFYFTILVIHYNEAFLYFVYVVLFFLSFVYPGEPLVISKGFKIVFCLFQVTILGSILVYYFVDDPPPQMIRMFTMYVLLFCVCLTSRTDSADSS